MKRFAFAVSLAAALCAAAGETLTMATEATFPPYEFLRGQEIAGIDVEICRAVAERLGREFRAENMDFDSVIPAVTSGKADLAAAGITVTEDRKKNVDFSVPYVTTGIVVIYRKAEPYTDADQLKGRKIGVQSGTTSDAYVLETLKQEPERFKSTPEACAAMLAGRCAFVIADIDPAKYCVKGEDRLGDWGTEVRAAVGKILRRKVRPTALFCSCDAIARHAMRAFAEVGMQVPEDVSLVGFDDDPIAEWTTLALTTVRQDFMAMGREAVKALVARIAKPAAPGAVVNVPVEFITRQSLARVRSLT